MNLADGRMISDTEAYRIIEDLYELTVNTKARGSLKAETVIAACERLIGEADREELAKYLMLQGMTHEKALRELEGALKILSPEVLAKRVGNELGTIGNELRERENNGFRVLRRPLGVLFHIAAGNVDALPAYSVVEGLLAGNINVLKLPRGVDDFSVRLLGRLVEIEPQLKDYIYVFDFPSTDTVLLQKIADAADAVVIWGGTEAVKSVRRLAGPDTKIIEWGHKLSFAYATLDAAQEQLEGIAFNICDTRGTLCSSCQGVYVDTEDFEAACTFAKRLFECLKSESRGREREFAVSACKTVEMHTEAIEALIYKDKQVLRDANCGIVVKRDDRLEPSYGFGNIWVKPLPRRKIVNTLAVNKRFLQTAAIAAGNEDTSELEELLIRAGVDRITNGREMSVIKPCEPHDGRLALSEYSKLVTIC